MLIINVPRGEFWDPKKNEFIYTEPCSIKMEHSLSSISKWESKWEKSFFLEEPKTQEETFDYIKDMLLDEVDDLTLKYICLNKDISEHIEKYINMPMTATKINNKGNNNRTSKSYVTSEVIYFWMITLNIPLECEHWHLNRLLTLIRVCEIKSQPPKKMSQQDARAYQARINAERRAKMKMKG